MCARSRSRGTEGTALRKKRNNAFFSRDCRCKTRRRMFFWMPEFSFLKVKYSVEDVAQVLLSAFLSAPQGESAGTSGACASEATICHTPIRVPKKAAIVEPTEHLKTVGQLQC